MLQATEIRVGNVLKIDSHLMKVLTQDVKGTGKFGKTVHLKLISKTALYLVRVNLTMEKNQENGPTFSTTVKCNLPEVSKTEK